MRIPRLTLHRPSGHARVRLSGRDFYCGAWGSPAATARYEELVAAWIANGRRRPPRRRRDDGAPDVTVARLVVDYLEHVAAEVARSGRGSGELRHLRIVLDLVLDTFARLQVVEFGPRALRELREQLIARDLARKTINEQVRRVRKMFRWAVAEELVPGEVIHRLEAVESLRRGDARETDPVEPAPDAAVDAVLPLVSAQVATMIRLQLLTGMRPGEVLSMKTGEIDRSGRVWLYRPARHKTEHHGIVRTIPLGPRAQGALRPWLRADPGAFLFSPQEAAQERRAEALDPRASRDRKRAPGPSWTAGSYRKAVQRACTRAGVALWSPNQLRHNAATSLRKAFGIETARVILGHTSTTTTQIYAELDLTRAISAMEEVG